jgi:hypothetical protein
MSTIKVDTITDAAGSGAPDFPNGMTGNGSSLTGLATAAQGALADTALQSSSSLAAANLTGALPAIDGSALTSLTSANLTGALPAIDGSALTGVGGSTTAGAVGTYMWARGSGSNVATSAFNFGSTYAGSGLYPAGFASQAAGSQNNSWYYSSGYGIGIGPTSTAARSGTWRCMGQTPTPTFDEMPTALFVRIS